MDELLLLSEAQMRRMEPFFPLSRGIPRVDDRRVLSGMLFVIRNGLRWRDAPSGYGPHKTIYNRFIRWSRMVMFDRIFAQLANSDSSDRLMIDATHLKAHRTAAQHSYDRLLYQQRHRIENMFARLKDWRRIHTRYDRCTHTFLSA